MTITADFTHSSKTSAPTAQRFDVVVIGGGAAGLSAAIGAAKAGAKTLLVERYGFLGGAATNSHVLTYCGFFNAGEPLVRSVGGVGWALLLELQKLGFDTAPIRSKSGNWIIPIDMEAVKFAFDRLVLTASVTLRLHTQLVSVQRTGDRIQSLTVVDHSGQYDIEADAFVDASGEATLSTYAGVDLSLKGGPGSKLQPASLPMSIGGVPPDVKFDREILTELVKRHNANSSIRIERTDGGPLMRLPISQTVWWMVIDIDTDGVSGADLTRAETQAREQAWTFLEVLRGHPGFENAYLAATGPQIGIRESRRPRSLSDVTGSDARDGLRREDGIARASWPMEVHEAPGRARFVPIGGEGFFDIPLGALEAQRVTNLLLAGRVVGCDPDAYGSIRVMGTAFATGQAAGVCAAVWSSSATRNPEEIRRILLSQGAII